MRLKFSSVLLPILLVLLFFTLMNNRNIHGYSFPSRNVSTDVGGSITENTTWTLTGSPYIVTSDVTVESNASLTIEPGTVVKFSSNTNLIVNGLLTARGNQTHVIHFTSNNTLPVAGDWGTIRISGSGSADISYVSVQYASTGITYQKEGQNSLENVNLTRNSLGLFLNTYPAELELNNCTVSHNFGSGIQLNKYSNVTITDTRITNNLGNGVSGGDYNGNRVIMDRSVASNNSQTGLLQISEVYLNNSKITYNGRYGIVGDYIVATNCSICHNGDFGIMVREGGLNLTYCEITYNGFVGISGEIRDVGVCGEIHYCDIHHNGMISTVWGAT